VAPRGPLRRGRDVGLAALVAAAALAALIVALRAVGQGPETICAVSPARDGIVRVTLNGPVRLTLWIAVAGDRPLAVAWWDGEGAYLAGAELTVGRSFTSLEALERAVTTPPGP